MPSGEVSISVKNLSKTYFLYPSVASRFMETIAGKRKSLAFPALSQIDFDIARGQTVGIIGRNGSGKSTLLRILAGIIDPSGGSYEVKGRCVPLLELGSGFVSDLDGYENAMLNARLLGLSKNEAAKIVDGAIAFAEIGEFAKQPVRTYSAGMLLRLGFAIAQNLNPDILLIDEVLAVGDQAFQLKCVRRIEEIKSAGATILVVTHSLYDIGGICDYVIQLDAGRIARRGPTQEVVKAYIEQAKTASDTPVFVTSNPHKRNTGEIVVESVRMTDAAGDEKKKFKTGEPAKISFSFVVNRPVINPMFRVNIFRSDGVLAFGTNTYRHDIGKGDLEAGGEVSVKIERLNLLEGTYWVNAGVYPDEYGKAFAEQAYDLKEHAVVFEVESERRDGAGLALVPHNWEIAP